MSVCHTHELNALQVAVLHRSSPNLVPRYIPRRCDHVWFLMEIWYIHLHQTRSGINFHHCFCGKIALMLDISKKMRYDVELKNGQIGNQPWHFDSQYELWPPMTLNLVLPSSKSLKFDVIFLKWWQIGWLVNGSLIGNHPCTIDWHHNLWHWLTLNCPRSGSRDLYFQYLEYREFT